MDKVQEHQLELLRMAQFPNISGERIVADLLTHQSLWCAVYVEFKWRIKTREALTQFWDLWHIYIFTIPGQEDALRSLAESWDPENICFTSENDIWKEENEEPFFTCDQEALDNEKLYLELWWDEAAWPQPGYLPTLSSSVIELEKK